ncbi:MAG: outer membrane beta-barrel protein [Acidobacteria bacterium]|nr:outer membrane beta-barrel protein [Acidobacteriota bacterium]
MQFAVRRICAFTTLILLCSSGTLFAQEPAPGYNSHWRNADGSEKLALAFGGGVNLSTGAARKYQGPAWNFQAGGGYRFNRRFALLGEYGFHHFRVPQQQVINYFHFPDYAEKSYVGRIRLWSITAQALVQYFATPRYGGYLIGGGGFFRKHTTVSSNGDCKNSTPGCAFAGGQPVRFSNNAPGFDIGTGLAYRPMFNDSLKLFIEARYVWVRNQGNSSYAGAVAHTTFVPVTAGIRW